MSRIKFFMISASEVREKIVCYIMTSSDWPYRHSDTVSQYGFCHHGTHFIGSTPSWSVISRAGDSKA